METANKRNSCRKVASSEVVLVYLGVAVVVYSGSSESSCCIHSEPSNFCQSSLLRVLTELSSSLAMSRLTLNVEEDAEGLVLLLPMEDEDDGGGEAFLLSAVEDDDAKGSSDDDAWSYVDCCCC